MQAEYEQVRQDREGKQERTPLLTLAESRAAAPTLDWSAHRPERPAAPGVHTVAPDLAELRPLIDWTPFFHTWRLPGRFPDILEDAEVGAEARRLLADAEALLDACAADGSLQARGVLGLFPAARDGDDLVVYADEERSTVRRRLPFLRQQRRSHGNRPNLSLADFVAPVGGPDDWVGAFVVSVAGAGDLAARAEQAGDDYAAILVKALADRLAEACAEWLHRELRRRYWGYAADEDLDGAALIAEEYRGIRPAPGYPACPDHLAKRWIFALLDAEAATGVALTESCAMAPAASVAGWYFAHPEARYFGMGRLGPDQVADYARRAGISLDEATRWLAPNLD